ncbi:hypothetical protein Bphy_1007 [Paraburkholderia phymatum STM815]|uniref:Uncharacterized protein n=1 Tax=Paraburkholderia phymatum (strain DSM 17167 / CIP 108236 / LMG 21445 / STM815) TaxID=391038 RepID=B2JGL1_PARP8|nr:hypothetical protein Bphy_1007 [Paraburkholderia phymatum STM815]
MHPQARDVSLLARQIPHDSQGAASHRAHSRRHRSLPDSTPSPRVRQTERIDQKVALRTVHAHGDVVVDQWVSSVHPCIASARSRP